MSGEIVNKVEKSGLINIDLKDWIDTSQIVELDIKPWLYEEMILREKDFRQHVKDHDWNQYSGKAVAVYCSVDAIVPIWAYMLISVNLQGTADFYFHGDRKATANALTRSQIMHRNISELRDKRVIVKGCSELEAPETAYLTIAMKLKPVVKTLMFGEACSTVPVWKRR